MAFNQINIDYKNNYFEKPELTRIHGAPSTSTLLKLRNEIRTNAQSVHSDLGGGGHGHLGMVCNPATYKDITGLQAVYIKPIHPGRFVVVGIDPTIAEVSQQKADWEQDMREYREADGVERALRQQIVSAVDDTHLKALRNSETGKITKDVPEILNHLFNCYGKVTPSELKEVKRQVEDYNFNPGDPIDNLFSEIDDLALVSTIANVPMSKEDKISMAYAILHQTRKFNSSLKEWNRLTPTEKTWQKFKKDFRVAQQELKKSGFLTVQSTMDRDELINIVTESINNAIVENPNDSSPNEIEAMNAAIQKDKNELQNEIRSLREQLKQVVNQQRQQSFNPMYCPPSQPPHNQQWPQSQMIPPPQYQWHQQHPSTTPHTTKKPKNDRKHTHNGRYCWTHGACDHWSNKCNSKADGHQNKANFKNTLGVSINGVRT